MKLVYLLLVPLFSLPICIAQTPACNRTLCFALSGSNTLTPSDFLIETAIATAIASNSTLAGSTHSAVQYGLINSILSARTADVTEFIARLEVALFASAEAGFVGAGLGFCVQDVKEAGGVGGAGVVVVLGDGKGFLADVFLEQVLSAVEEEMVLAVGVGTDVDVDVLTRVVGGTRENVFVVAGGDEAVADVVERVVERVCGQENAGLST